jgi:hypothetical protein
MAAPAHQNQTPDLSANKTSFYDWNSQSWLSTSPITNPCFTMTASASYNDGTTATVSLSASSATVANPTIYYTIDGSTPTTASHRPLQIQEHLVSQNDYCKSLCED